MRHLAYCESHVTDHHKNAWIALAELSAFVKARELHGSTIVSVNLCLDEDANYYAEVVVEH